MRHLKTPLILLLTLLLAVSPFAFAAYENVAIYYNGEQLAFPAAGPYYDAQAECVMVPVRAFSESIGAQVEFDTESGDILVQIFNTGIRFNISSQEAVVNNVRRIALPAVPVIADGTSFVPLDAITGAMNIDYSWDVDTLTAQLSASKTYTLGVGADLVRLNYGIPQRSDRSEQGFDWYIYNEIPGQLSMIGISNAVVTAYYLYQGSWELPCGIYCGMPVDNANSLMRIQEYAISVGNCSIAYANDEEYIVAYLDPEGESIAAVLYEDIAWKDQFEINDRVTASFALQLHDLLNAFRTGLGYQALPQDSMLASLAGQHVADMAQHNYFGHLDLRGMSNEERFTAAGYGECYCAEAIAQAYRNSFDAFAELIKDVEYQALAAANFNASGCAVAYNADSDGLVYYAQVFYAPKE